MTRLRRIKTNSLWASGSVVATVVATYRQKLLRIEPTYEMQHRRVYFREQYNLSLNNSSFNIVFSEIVKKHPTSSCDGRDGEPNTTCLRISWVPHPSHRVASHDVIEPEY